MTDLMLPSASSRVCLRGFARWFARLAAFVALATATAPVARAADPVFDAKGFNPNRQYLSDLPFEHVDPMTGNVLLTYTDVVLPGNAGFELRVQRTYNSKIYSSLSNAGGFTLEEDSWAGLGWTLHFGRIANPDSTTPGPVVEMPDGSRHPLFTEINQGTSRFVSKDFWKYDRNLASPVLSLPNGVTYTFGRRVTIEGTTYLYATLIADPFDNQVVIEYVPGYPLDGVSKITQSVGNGQTRTVTFTTTSTIGGVSTYHLTGMTVGYVGGTGPTYRWTYTHDALGNSGHTYLRVAQPALGPSWRFDYYTAGTDPAQHTLKTVTTPNGGQVQYVFKRHLFYVGSSVIYTPAVETRTLAGRDIGSSAWTYAYASSTAENATTITCPCGTTLQHKFVGVDPSEPSYGPWTVGSLKSKTISQTGGPAFETETFVWTPSEPISNDAEGYPAGIHVALVGSRTVQRGGKTFTTTNSYHTANFNDYGRPYLVTETGDLTRTTDRSFQYGFSRYIVDKAASEEVTFAGESYLKTYAYDLANGFLESDTVYGITTTYARGDFGNVASKEDGNGHRTRYTYAWGVTKDIITPVGFSITRVINGDGAVQSEKRNGYTTSFQYDGLGRVMRKTPPTGNAWVTTYDNTAGTYVQTDRGVSPVIGRVKTTLDGFGRSRVTSSYLNEKIEAQYDSCGRRFKEFLPFTGTSGTLATTYTYDALGRLKEILRPDNSKVTYTFAGLDVTVVETLDKSLGRTNTRSTTLYRKAFGDPDDARLVAVKDAEAQITYYTYNGLGGLTSVDHPGALSRTWLYFAGTNRVKQEIHPESGTVSFTYDDAGNLVTRSDPAFGQSAFGYDGNDRLTTVNRPGSQHDVYIGYDASDNRIKLDNIGAVQSKFVYDGASRLTRREDTIAGELFVTAYGYDGNDNVIRITYPSGSRVGYSYGAENRLSKVNNDATGTAEFKYAHGFAYHVSGGVKSYLSGNGLLNELDYDPKRYRLSKVKVGTHLDLTYGYDDVGNVLSIGDARLGAQSFGYDDLDRLVTTSGWGAGGYGYDAVGNRTSKSLSGVPETSYTYSPTTNRLTSSSGGEPATFTYDANGNTRVDGLGQYTYAPSNLMETATVTGITTTYRYDGDDLRKLKLETGKRSFYLHGPGNQILSEYEQIGTGPIVPIREYIYGGQRLVASLKPPALVVSRSSMTFAAPSGAAAPPAQSLSIAEANGAALAWAASRSATWITLSATSGTTPSTLSVSVDPTGLVPGTYVGTVAIAADGAVGSPKVVTVRFIVTDGPGLVVGPSSLSYSMTEGGSDPFPETLDVLYSGGGPVGWTAETMTTWLSISETAGTTPSSLAVTVDGSGLEAGTYRSAVIVTAPGAIGSPKIVPVELVVTPGAGATCAQGAHFCEPFDQHADGEVGGQGGWQSVPYSAQVVPDPRGDGNALRLDPAPEGYVNDHLNIADVGISGIQISAQVMALSVPTGTRQVAKLEFYTRAGSAWGKTHRTFGALRFGGSLMLQYGPNINKVLVDRLEHNRWYNVKVTYQSNKIEAYVDGSLRFSTTNPLAPGLNLEAFSTTGWDFPGAGYLDLIDVRPIPTGLVVDPGTLKFRAGSSSSEARAEGPSRVQRASNSAAPHGSVAPTARVGLRDTLLALPLAFEPVGGDRPASAFAVRGKGFGMRFDRAGVRMSIAGPSEGGRPASLSMTLKGGTPARLEATDPLPGKSHYFVGRDPAAWRTSVPQFAKVHYDQIYPGVDLVFYGKQGQLEYDLVVAPGASPKAVRLQFEGAEGLRIDEDGDLVMDTTAGPVRQHRPLVYQDVAGERRTVPGRYVLAASNEVAFEVGPYEAAEALVIDPVLTYSTAFGGAGIELPGGIDVDEDGFIYVGGRTNSADFPLVGPVQPGFGGGNYDAFVTKIDPANSVIVYSTYLGGSAAESDNLQYAPRLAVDGLGSAHIVGVTQSTDFPVLSALQPSLAGGLDAFVTKLSPDGGSIVYSTYVGGSGSDQAPQIALGSDGHAYVALRTSSSNLPFLTGGYQGAHSGFLTDAYVAHISDTGGLVATTYFGAYGSDNPAGIVAGSGQVHLLLNTTSNNLPTESGFQSTHQGLWDAYVVRLSSGLSSLDYATYLGGSGTEEPTGLAVDDQGRIAVTGATYSTNFPMQNPVQGQLRAGSDVFVSTLSGSSLVFSTYLGGESLEKSSGGVAFDPEGNVYVAGKTGSADFPLLNPIQSVCNGASDWFLAKFDPAGELLYSTYLGGSGTEEVGDLAVDNYGSLHVVGYAGDFPVLNPLPGDPPPGALHAVVAVVSDSLSGAAPRFQFDATAYEAVEEEQQAVVVVTRLGDLSAQATVEYVVSDGTATAPGDYAATSGTLSFARDESALAFVVPIVDDNVAEEDQTVIVTLQNPSTGTTLGYPSTATLTIRDDDGLTRTFTVRDRILAVGPNWTASEGIPWLTLDAYSGVGPSTVTATVNPEGLDVGTYTGTITVTGDTGDSPQFIGVTLKVDVAQGCPPKEQCGVGSQTLALTAPEKGGQR